MQNVRHVLYAILWSVFKRVLKTASIFAYIQTSTSVELRTETRVKFCKRRYRTLQPVSTKWPSINSNFVVNWWHNERYGDNSGKWYSGSRRRRDKTSHPHVSFRAFSSIPVLLTLVTRDISNKKASIIFFYYSRKIWMIP